MSPPIRHIIHALLNGENLSQEAAGEAMRRIMAGDVSPVHLAAFLVALRMKGETPEEIAGCAEAMRKLSVRIPTRHPFVLDTCGTGGDQSGSFNISTATALVAAAAGIPVAKHGNRAVSSRAGSADVLEALGVRLEADSQIVGRILDEVGITFLFAPHLHPAMKHAVGVRKELATRTIFNILGPLTNPASATAQVLGVFAKELTGTLAQVLVRLGTKHAFVVHGADGLDEFTLSGPTYVSEAIGGKVRSYEVRPADVGLPAADASAVRGGDAAENAGIIRTILDGNGGPRRDIVVLNAAAALVAGGKAADLKEGTTVAAEVIGTGRARTLLQRWIEASQSMT